MFSRAESNTVFEMKHPARLSQAPSALEVGFNANTGRLARNKREARTPLDSVSLHSGSTNPEPAAKQLILKFLINRRASGSINFASQQFNNSNLSSYL